MVERRRYPRAVPATPLPRLLRVDLVAVGLLTVGLLALGLLAFGPPGPRVDLGSVAGRAAQAPTPSTVVLPGTVGAEFLAATRPQALPLVRPERGAPSRFAAGGAAAVDGRARAAFGWWLAPSLLTGLLLASAGIAVRHGRAPPAGSAPASTPA